MLRSSFRQCAYVSWDKFSLERGLFVLQAKWRGRGSEFNAYTRSLPTRVQAMAACTIRGLKKIGVQCNFPKVYKPSLKVPSPPGNSISVCLGSLYRLKELSLVKVKEFLRFAIDELAPSSIFLLGDQNKWDDGEKLRMEFPNAQVVNRCGKTTLTEAAGLLSTSRFALANDSALAHLCEAVGTPVLMFFGPTHSCFGYAPHLDRSLHFSTDLSCRPCHKNGNTQCRFHDELCKTTVDLKPVFTHAKLLFG